MMDAWILVASEDATAGSVMAKHERMRPSSSGTNHAHCCSGVPYLASTCASIHPKGRAIAGMRWQ